MAGDACMLLMRKAGLPMGVKNGRSRNPLMRTPNTVEYRLSYDKDFLPVISGNR